MKIVAYIYTDEEDSNLKEQDIQKQKFLIASFCNSHGLSLSECLIENPETDSFEYPVLFKLLSNNKSFSKIIFSSSQIFDSNPEFQNWIFSELKARNIKFEFADRTEKKHTIFDIEKKKELLIEKANNVPSLPVIVTKTLQLIQNDKSSASQLSRIIKYDTGLTGKILKLVNSSMYGFSKQISSIQHGIAILGFNTIKGLVISSNIYKSFRSSKMDDLFDYDKFWLHTTLCATIANEFSSKLYQDDEKEEIFSSAILHNIGKLILNKYDNENYRNVLTDIEDEMQFEKNIEIEEKYCTLAHTTVGKIVTEKWNLPEFISEVAAFHHSPTKAKDDYKKAVCLINISDILANSILYSEELDKNLFSENIQDLAGINYLSIQNKFNDFKEKQEKLAELKNFFKEE